MAIEIKQEVKKLTQCRQILNAAAEQTTEHMIDEFTGSVANSVLEDEKRNDLTVRQIS